MSFGLTKMVGTGDIRLARKSRTTYHADCSCQDPPPILAEFGWADGYFVLEKTCAFLGNDYDFMSGRKRIRRPNLGLREKIEEKIINLIEKENVTNFLVGEIGGFEKDAYDTILKIKKILPNIKIILVISRTNELHTKEERYFDDFIFPDKCAIGYKRLSIVYRNQYIIENTDFIIAYNKYKYRAHKFCEKAKNKGVKVVELA